MALLLELSDLTRRMNLDLSTMAETAKAQYMMLLEGMDKAVKSWLHYDPTRVSADVQYYDGNGQTTLVLRTPFVVDNATLDVRLDQGGYYGHGSGAFAAATELTIGEGFVLKLEGTLGKSGVLYKLPSNPAGVWAWPSDQFLFGNRQGLSFSKGAYWPVGMGNIKVTCDYGFAPGSIPEDLRLAVAMGVAIARNLVVRGVFVTGENLGDYTYSGQLIESAPFASIQAYLRPYRDVSV